MSLLLGCDIGTTSIKAILYDTQQGKVVRSAIRPTPVQRPDDQWSEHDPEQIWRATCDCIREVSESSRVTGLAVSSMAETGVLVDSNYEPLSPMIAWYDRRSEAQAAAIETRIRTADLYSITGQRVSPSFGVTKILWTKDIYPEIYARAYKWLPVPAFISQRLTGQAAVDYTIASRTLLFDQRRLAWSENLLNLFDLNPEILPPAYIAGTAIGYITKKAAMETGLSSETICVLGGHDHLCATLAAGGSRPGAVIDSTGSANALLMLTPDFLPDPGLAERSFASYAYVLSGLYVLKGGLKASGSAIEWLARRLSGNEEPDYRKLELSATPGVGKQAGPIWLPHLIGSGTPEGDRFSRAAIIGAQFEHQPGDLFRGLLESLAFWTRQNLEEMQAVTGSTLGSLALLGGVTRLRLLSQLKADVMNHNVHIPGIPEAAATGAALLAGMGSGEFISAEQAIGSLRYESEVIEPDHQRAIWYEEMYQQAYLPLYNRLKPIHAALDQIALKSVDQNDENHRKTGK